MTFPTSLKFPMSKQYLFAYGSLINEKSRHRTIGRDTNAIPARVIGLLRSWSYRCNRKQYTAVSVERQIDHSKSINGVLIPLDDPINDLKALDCREISYARAIISHTSVIPLGSEQIELDAVIWVYETITALTPCNYSSTSKPVSTVSKCHSPSPSCPIPQSYIDCIITGCLSISLEFAQEFIRTTFGWSLQCMLNDRNHCVKHRKYPLYGNANCCIVDPQLIDGIVQDCLPYDLKYSRKY